MQKIFENWRKFSKKATRNKVHLNEATEKWIKNADQRVINDVLRAAKDAGADEFTTRLLMGFLKIETRGKAKFTFYNPEMAKYKGVKKRPHRIEVTDSRGRVRKIRPIGPFQVLQGVQNEIGRRYGYDPGKFGDPYHQAQVMLRFIEKKRKKFGDDPARIYLTWNQGPRGSRIIYNALKNDPDGQISGTEFARDIARNMRGNFSKYAFDKYGISSKDEITPRIFVDRYTSLLMGPMGKDLPMGDTTSTTSEEKYVIIAGNSHSQAAKKYIIDKYKELEKKTGDKYNIEYIGASQGKGGEIKGQLSRIQNLSKELKDKDANVTAVIHIGTMFPKEHNFDKLAKEYSKLTNNISVIGNPNPSSGYENTQIREKWNNYFKENQENLGIKYIETWGNFKDDDIRGDNLHLTRAGYKKMMDSALPQIEFGAEGSMKSAAANVDAGISTINIKIGKFVHGFKEENFPDFNFDSFYKELDSYFKDQGGASGMLEKHGKDYKFGREHKAAWDVLQGIKASQPPAEAPYDTETALQTCSDGTVQPAGTCPPTPTEIQGPEGPVEPTLASATYVPQDQNLQTPEETDDSSYAPFGSWPTELLDEDIYASIQYEYEKLISEQFQRWSSQDLIKVDIALKYEKAFSFYGNVLNQIRSIKGVTIAKADEAGVVDVYPDKKMVLLHLKFMPDRPISQYIVYLQSELKKIKDNDGDRVLATQIKSIPQKIKS